MANRGAKRLHPTLLEVDAKKRSDAAYDMLKKC